jgi:hypothetical protein
MNGGSKMASTNAHAILAQIPCDFKWQIYTQGPMKWQVPTLMQFLPKYHVISIESHNFIHFRMHAGMSPVPESVPFS